MLRGRLLGRDGERPHHVVVFVLDDVAVMDIFLWCHHAGRQIEFGPDPGEIAGIGFDCFLKAALRRIGRLLWSRRKWTWIVPAGDSVRALKSLLVGLDVKRGPADHLEGNQMSVRRVSITRDVDI